MAEETEITEDDTDDVADEETATEETESEETTSKDDKSEDKTADAKAKEAEGESKDTKVLLSDDEDDGAGDDDVPDKYEFVSPEDIGEFEMTPEVQAQFDSFGERAKAAKLSQKQYQTLVEDEIRRGRAVMSEMAGDYQQRVEGWADTTKSDKEMGGEDLTQTLSNAALGMKTFGTPELNSLFKAPSPENPDGLGIGNHPEIIRLLHRVGEQVNEDGNLVDGDGDKVQSDAALRRMYPSMFKEEAAA